jgi:hypothetical protein
VKTCFHNLLFQNLLFKYSSTFVTRYAWEYHIETCRNGIVELNTFFLIVRRQLTRGSLLNRLCDVLYHLTLSIRFLWQPYLIWQGWHHFSRSFAFKTPVDDSQYGPCNVTNLTPPAEWSDNPTRAYEHKHQSMTASMVLAM